MLEPEKAKNIRKLPEQKGDCNELQEISEFVGKHYDEVALDKIKAELQILEKFEKDFSLGETDSLYFFARKMVIIGELCNELARDFKDNEQANKDLVDIFRNLNQIRNSFIHSHSKILLDLTHLPFQKLQEANACTLEFIKDFNNILSKDILKNGVDKQKQNVLQKCLKNSKGLNALLGRTTKYRLKHKLESELVRSKKVLDLLFSEENKSLISLYQKTKVR